jgi:U3 small nucleolar RNA-associated protein 20
VLAPIRDVLTRTEALKTMRVVDDTLGRIGQGVQGNNRIDTFALLSLCHSFISLDAAFLRIKSAKDKKKASADYEVRLTRDGGFEADHYPANSHRFVAFGLDLLNVAFRKNRFDLHDPETVARLDPLIAAVGDAVFSKDSHVLLRALRATAALVRCPLASVDKAAPILTEHIMGIVLKAGGTQAETTQVALRTLATVVRDCKTVSLPEKQLTGLVKLVAPDLEEAERQVTVFTLVRALLSRKFACPELYDLMDRVAEVLVTNQAAAVREACRAMYLQFLLDYLHGKARLRSAMSFLVKNLGYVHESGRTSVMELLHAVITKFSAPLLDDSAELFFIGLVMTVVNEESSQARERALGLVKTLLARISSERRVTFVALLTTWAQQAAQRQLAVVAIQLCATLVEGDSAEAKAAIPALMTMLVAVVERAAEELEEAERQPETVDDDDEAAWRLPYQALQALSRIFAAQPTLFASQDALWSAVRGLLLHPHGWVRTASARLLGTLFAARTTETDLELPDLIDVAVKSSIQLRSPLLSDALALQIVKNLFFVGRRFSAVEATTAADEEDESDEDDDEAGEDRYDRETQPLRWLFARLAKQARQAHNSRPSMYELQRVRHQPCRPSH